jgi:ribosome biogenesis GTPase
LTLPSTAGLLHSLGWDDGWNAAFEVHRAAGLMPARVAVQHRGAYDLIGEGGEVRASAVVRLAREGGLPAVGDWVAVDPETGLIEAVLPRRTAVSRKEVWTAVKEQVLAANVDIVFLTQALPLDFSPRRLERYLAMAWESGAQPVVLLTKIDLVDDVAPYLAEVDTATLGSCLVLAVSARTGVGLDEVRALFGENRTAVLLGSSGVGKSTIVNAFAGNDAIATQEVRESDQRGRHTTTRRELVLLPGGGVILDTPGMRELQLWDADLQQTFGDVEEIAARCRFTDCSHDREPDCAVREALADGTLAADRWESYRKLQREVAALELRRDAQARKEQRRQYKIRERAMRRNQH